MMDNVIIIQENISSIVFQYQTVTAMVAKISIENIENYLM